MTNTDKQSEMTPSPKEADARRQECGALEDGAGGQRAVLDLLSDPAAYGGVTGPIDRIDTHISAIFLAGERAYKLKRAVAFPYLDFSTPGKRYRACLQELRINRRTAPEIYLGLCAVVADDEGRPRLGPLDPEPSEARQDAGALDWVVVMRRFSQDDLLDRVAASNRLDMKHIDLLAKEVAAFHEQAPPVTGGGAQTLRHVTEETVVEFRSDPEMFSAPEVERLADDCDRWLSRLSRQLDQRAESGFVRHCHGDLHLRNIVLLDGHPRLFDAIEFDETLAHIDVLYDLAFLLMDLDSHGHELAANRMLNGYLSHRDDIEGLAALPLFLALRAAIRAKVQASAAAAQADSEKRAAARSEAGRFFASATTYLQPPAPHLVAVGGVSGTGKTTLARLVAPSLGAAPGAVVIRSDVERKRLLGVDEHERLPEDAYRGRVNAEVYRRMFARAERALRAGHSVIVEATFLSRNDRRVATRLAEDLRVPFAGLWLTAPNRTLKERVAARHGDASDATPEIVEAQLSRAPSGPIPWPAIDASGPPEAVAAQAREVLFASGQIAERRTPGL